MIVVVVVVLLCSVPQFNQSNTVVMIMIYRFRSGFVGVQCIIVASVSLLISASHK